MGLELIWIALGIAAAGYFIGYGLKNFQNPSADGLSDIFNDEENELIKESHAHYVLGISKEDAKYILQEHPDMPHVVINGTVYYPKGKLKKWIAGIGE